MPVRGAISLMEREAMYSNAEAVCVTNLGVRTTQFIRQRELLDPNTGLPTGPIVTEYSANGSAWTIVVPAGTIVAGACAVPDPTDVVVPPTRISSSAVGATALNAWSVSIINVGVAAGLVQGVAILPGESVDYESYFDTTVGLNKRLPIITYDGTGTVLRVMVQP